MKLCKSFLTIMFLAGYSLIFAQGTYYNNIDPAKTSFVIDLQKLINPHTVVSYDNFDETNVANFASSDAGNGMRKFTGIYSGTVYTYKAPFTWGTVYSREHTWCHSWMPTNPATGKPEYSDQHHLFPLHQNNENGPRGNTPLGNVAASNYTYGECKKGTDVANHEVFEPRASHKGDAARALFYMAVCYNGVNGKNWSFDYLKANVADAKFQDVNTLIQWAKQDPPDAWEISRNNYIYTIQKNRNPFVDHPEWIDRINFNNLTYISMSNYAVEPTNYPTSFAAMVANTNSAQLSWADAVAGTQVPSGYVIYVKTTNSFTNPVDGTPVADDLNLADGTGCINVAYSAANSYSFTTLPSGTYYFKTYSYNSVSGAINYKTDGTAPSASLVISNNTTAPQVSINSPSANSAFSVGSTVSITANASTTAPATVSKVDFYVDGTLKSSDTSSPYAYNWTSTGATTGVHAMKTVVTNSSNLTAENQISITLTTNSTTYTNIIPIRTDLSGFSTWTDNLVTAGSGYMILKSSTSRTTTPAMNFSAYSQAKLNLKARTYGGTNSTNNTVKISVSTNNGTSWTLAKSVVPTSSTLSEQTTIDLSAYTGTQVKVKFETTGANGTKGAGLDDIKFTGIAAKYAEIDENPQPQTAYLCQNYPNPFNPSTTISYELATVNYAKLAVYNAKGELVKTLFDGIQNSGKHSVIFDGAGMNSGVYFYKLQADGRTIVNKMLLCK